MNVLYVREGHAEKHTAREAFEGSVAATIAKLLNGIDRQWIYQQPARAARDDLVLLQCAQFEVLTESQQHRIVTKLGWVPVPNA